MRGISHRGPDVNQNADTRLGQRNRRVGDTRGTWTQVAGTRQKTQDTRLKSKDTDRNALGTEHKARDIGLGVRTHARRYQDRQPHPGGRWIPSHWEKRFQRPLRCIGRFLVPREGIEPPTKRLEGSCSIH